MSLPSDMFTMLHGIASSLTVNVALPPSRNGDGVGAVTVMPGVLGALVTARSRNPPARLPEGSWIGLLPGTP